MILFLLIAPSTRAAGSLAHRVAGRIFLDEVNADAAAGGENFPPELAAIAKDPRLRAYFYGGTIAPDMDRSWSTLDIAEKGHILHPAPLARTIRRQAGSLEEVAFAHGWLVHCATDLAVHEWANHEGALFARPGAEDRFREGVLGVYLLEQYLLRRPAVTRPVIRSELEAAPMIPFDLLRRSVRELALAPVTDHEEFIDLPRLLRAEKMSSWLIHEDLSSGAVSRYRFSNPVLEIRGTIEPGWARRMVLLHNTLRNPAELPRLDADAEMNRFLSGIRGSIDSAAAKARWMMAEAAEGRFTNRDLYTTFHLDTATWIVEVTGRELMRWSVPQTPYDLVAGPDPADDNRWRFRIYRAGREYDLFDTPDSPARHWLDARNLREGAVIDFEENRILEKRHPFDCSVEVEKIFGAPRTGGTLRLRVRFRMHEGSPPDAQRSLLLNPHIEPTATILTWDRWAIARWTDRGGRSLAELYEWQHGKWRWLLRGPGLRRVRDISKYTGPLPPDAIESLGLGVREP